MFSAASQRKVVKKLEAITDQGPVTMFLKPQPFWRRFISGPAIIALAAVLLTSFNTVVFQHWSPIPELEVSDYLRDLPNLDNVIRYRRQFEPVYPLAVATHVGFSQLSYLTAINFSRFALQLLILLFAGLIVFELTKRTGFAVAAVVMVAFSASFWSLSINLMRNLHGLALTAAFLWVLIRFFGRPAHIWFYRLASGILLAAILETHIVMAIIVIGALALFFFLWLIRSFVPPKNVSTWLLKDLLIVAALTVVLSLPYDYVRFYLQQFYRVHEFVIPPKGEDRGF